MQLGASSYCTFWHITLQSGLPVYWYPTAAMSKIRYPQVPGNPNLQKVNTKQQRAKICHRRVKNPTNRSYRCNRSHFFCSSLKTSIAINYNSLSNNANHTFLAKLHEHKNLGKMWYLDPWQSWNIDQCRYSSQDSGKSGLVTDRTGSEAYTFELDPYSKYIINIPSDTTYQKNYPQRHKAKSMPLSTIMTSHWILGQQTGHFCIQNFT